MVTETQKAQEPRLGNGKLRLYVIEEQQLLRDAYKTGFSFESEVEVLDISANLNLEAITAVLSAVKPHALLWGTKTLQPTTLSQLEALRERFPQMGLVVLFTGYDAPAIQQLVRFTKINPRGCAFLFKHAIDRIDQLVRVARAVTEGQVIMDSDVMEEMVSGGQSGTQILKQLSHRELEVMSWMARGYGDRTIAELLCVDADTIGRHINSIYSKLHITDNAKHPRVNSILLYLRATGQIPVTPVD